MSKFYAFHFYNDNFVRQTQKAWGMAFHEDISKITWFAKSKSTIERDFFGEGDHALIVHPWLTNQILGAQEGLKDLLLSLKQLEVINSEIDFAKEDREEDKVDGTVWADPMATGIGKKVA